MSLFRGWTRSATIVSVIALLVRDFEDLGVGFLAYGWQLRVTAAAPHLGTTRSEDLSSLGGDWYWGLS